MNADNELQDEAVMAGADEPRHSAIDQPDTRNGDPDQLPDGSGSDVVNPEEGEDTASGGGADDE